MIDYETAYLKIECSYCGDPIAEDEAFETSWDEREHRHVQCAKDEAAETEIK